MILSGEDVRGLARTAEQDLVGIIASLEAALESKNKMLGQMGELSQFAGDLKRMAHDVDFALQQIVAKYGNKSAEEAKVYVTQLVKSRRYQKDVY